MTKAFNEAYEIPAVFVISGSARPSPRYWSPASSTASGSSSGRPSWAPAPAGVRNVRGVPGRGRGLWLKSKFFPPTLSPNDYNEVPRGVGVSDGDGPPERSAPPVVSPSSPGAACRSARPAVTPALTPAGLCAADGLFTARPDAHAGSAAVAAARPLPVPVTGPLAGTGPDGVPATLPPTSLPATSLPAPTLPVPTLPVPSASLPPAAMPVTEYGPESADQALDSDARRPRRPRRHPRPSSGRPRRAGGSQEAGMSGRPSR
ncbi:hypothetical protein NKH18_17345 [Streptomyces sp. M10(2022)]